MKKIILCLSIFLITGYASFACETDGLYPDKNCTPGDIFPNISNEQICVKGYSATVRNVPKSVKTKVYEDYNILPDERKNYVIDHLISLQIGGTNEIPNLFPQKSTGEINSRTKDKIENFLKREVCKGNMTLKKAQKTIVEDWLEVLDDYNERGEK